MPGKITHAQITAMPESLFDPMPKVIVRVDGGEEQELFSFYPDEISFSAEEFIGLTTAEAVALKASKDLRYLQS